MSAFPLIPLRTLRQSLRLVWRGSRPWPLYYLIILVVQAILPLAGLYLTKLLVDSVVAQAGVVAPPFSEVAVYIGLLAAVWLLGSGLLTLGRFVAQTQQHLFVDYMAERLQAQSISLDLAYYENPEYHNTFHRAQEEAAYRPIEALNSVFELIQSGLSLLAIAGLLFFLHWAVVLLLFVAAAPSVWIKMRYARRLYEWDRRATGLERKANYLNQILTADRTAKEARLFDYGERLRERFRALRRRLFQEKHAILRRQAVADLSARGIEVFSVAAAYGFVAWRALRGALSVGDLVMYFQAFQRGQSSLRNFFNAGADLYQHRLFLNHIFEFLELRPQISDPPAPKALPPSPLSRVDFEGVHFVYPQTQAKVLRDIRLTLRRGEVVAFVGPNGSGKTTLLKLLARLYDPSEGAIRFDGIDLRECGLREARDRVALIFQDYVGYQLSAADNIQLSDPRREPDLERARRAARLSGADQFIEQLPRGYEHLLGRAFDDGAELSGGQWQKIALARAFYKNADIIALDEPTSAIDPLAEYEIFAQLKALARDKMLIIVTHRLYNLDIADRIVFFDQGAIVEMGDHATLLARGGAYARMYRRQVRVG